MIMKAVSIIFGLVFLATGLIPILKSTVLQSLSFELSSLGVVIWILSAVASVLIIVNSIRIDGMSEIQGKLKIVSIVGGVVLLASSVFLILSSLGIFGMPPGIMKIVEGTLAAPFILAGFLLIYSGVSYAQF